MSTSLTVMSGERSGSIAVVGAALSEAVKYPIRELMIAFPSPNISAEERTVQLGIYRDAVLGFEEELVVSVAKWMRFNNPRNTPSYTQPPTPQDLHVAIRNRRETLARQSAEYFFGILGHDDLGRRRWKRVRDKLPDCSRALAEKLAIEQYRANDHDELIDRMSEEAFNDLPSGLFDPSTRQSHLEFRAHLSYLRGLDDDTWHMRRALLMHDRHCRLHMPDYREPRITEDSLMKQANELVAEFRVRRPLDDHDFQRKFYIGEFLREKKLHVGDDRQLWPNDLRCVSIEELKGEPVNGAVAEIVNLTARMIGEANQ